MEKKVVTQDDQKDVKEATHDINGGFNGLKEREAAAAEWERKLDAGYRPGQTAAKTEQATSHAAQHPNAPDTASNTRQVQGALNTLGYTDSRGRPIAIDGIEGHATKAAITAFQHDNNLTPDGIAGPRTQAALNAQIKDTQAPVAAAASHPSSPSQAGAPQQPAPSTTAQDDHSYWHTQAMAGRAMQQNQAAANTTMPKMATPLGY